METKTESRYKNPTPETIRKVRRVQEMIDNHYGSAPACREVGISSNSFYQYRKHLGIGKPPNKKRA